MIFHSWLGLPEKQKRIVSLCGGGGKTTLMLALAQECCREQRASIFTTTHIFPPAGENILFCEPFSQTECRAAWRDGRIVAAGTFLTAERKFGAPAEETMRFLCREADGVFVEADGSRRLPLKFPNRAHEPRIRVESTHIVVLAGLSALGRNTESVFHRWELARRQLDLPEDTVTEEMMARVLFAGYGDIASTFFLNQADTPERCEKGLRTAEKLKALGACRCVVASLQNPSLGAIIL